jgi:biotin transporter BioY
MPALTTTLVTMDCTFSAWPRVPALRLGAWRPMPWLLTPVRLAMSAGMGAVFGASTGHPGFWVPAGLLTGLALMRVWRAQDQS